MSDNTQIDLREKRRQELGETQFSTNAQGGALMQPRNGKELMDMANMMSSSGSMIRDFYRGNPGDCAALIMICQPYGFNPFMTASPTSFSVATGVTIIYDLDFPMAAAGLDYKIVISTTGTGPFHWGVDIPLTIDRLALMTFSGSYPFHRAWNMQGILDANGNGTGQIGTVPGDHAAYIGSTAWWVAIVIPTGSLASYSSVAVPITIMP